MTYVYPVVSRRAGGVSVGINLNPNNACNWRCIYCQVPDLTRGGPPPIDLNLLVNELRDLLNWLYIGDYLDRHVPPAARRVVDIAFSGNGEPTSAAEFPRVVAQVIDVLAQFTLESPPKLRLITNGSLIDRTTVKQGIAQLGAQNGEVWFKVDAVGDAVMRRINAVSYAPDTVLRRLRQCGSLAPTWVQTCWFACDGHEQDATSVSAYLELLRAAKDSLHGVLLYGLARPSLQPEATRLSPVTAERLNEVGRQIGQATGLTVQISP